MADGGGGYGVAARILHWSLAALILALFALGIAAVELDYYNRFRGDALLWHRQLGVVAFAVALAVLLRRLAGGVPSPVASLRTWEVFAASAAHRLLLFFALLLPLSGYCISTSSGAAVPFFGWELPALFAVSDALREAAEAAHFYGGYAMLALVCAHAGAAFKHHFVDRNEVLTRMIRGAGGR